MSDKREPNIVLKSSKPQLPIVNRTQHDKVIQNKDRNESNDNVEFAQENNFSNEVDGDKYIQNGETQNQYETKDKLKSKKK